MCAPWRLGFTLAPLARRGVAGWLALCACAGAISAGEVARSESPLSGILVACKEYGTQLGVFLLDARGRDLRRLNHLCGEEVSPRLSPDSTRVLFSCARGGKPGVWVMDMQGKNQQRICDGDQASWVAGGKQILFRREGHIWWRSLEDGQESLRSPAAWTACSWPSASPDARTILCVLREGGKDVIMTMGRDGQPPKRLAEGEIPSAPRWNPDGTRIAYQNGPHLWTMDADGTNRRQLTVAGGIQRCPAWSPDGSTIAYCQGPSPQGPWQLCVTKADGTKTAFLGPPSARRVLAPDWGTHEGADRAIPWPARPAGVRSEPGVRVWDTVRPLHAPPADWQAAARASEGWLRITHSQDAPLAIRGACVVQNETSLLFLPPGKAGLSYMPQAGPRATVGLVPLSSQGQPAEVVESIRVVECGHDEAIVETTSRTQEGDAVRIFWRIGTGAPWLRAAPLANAGGLRVLGSWRAIVVPDRLANDLALAAEEYQPQQAFLVAAPLTIALSNEERHMLVFMRPKPGQRLEIHKEQQRFTRADLAFQDTTLGLGLVQADGAGHTEGFAAAAAADRYAFHWQMPFPAHWRLAVHGKAASLSAMFCEKESEYYADKEAFLRKTEKIGPGTLWGMIYLYDRNSTTPLDVFTPADLLREMLGLDGTQTVLDIQGVSGYRTGSRWTTWSDFGKTVRSLEYLFERNLEVEQNVYVGHLCDDLVPLVEGMDQRLDEYARWAGDVGPYGGPSREKPAGDPLATALAKAARQLSDLDHRRLALRKRKELPPLCDRIKRLSVRESRRNAGEFEQIRQALLAIAGPREDLLRGYRRVAQELCDDAARSCLAHAPLLPDAQRVRELCHGVLRNRHYSEGDWRGEPHEEPLDWLGPRPYE